jgi:hypothetical protein
LRVLLRVIRRYRHCDSALSFFFRLTLCFDTETPNARVWQDLHRMIKILLVGDTDRRPDLNEVLQMEVCTSKLFKSNIAIDVLQVLSY